MNSDLTGGKRRARHTPEQVALEQAVMRAQAERLSLHPEGLRGLLAQGSLPPLHKQRQRQRQPCVAYPRDVKERRPCAATCAPA